ncbi:SdpI family protein [Nocardiopsis sp. CC223A]|uniref:SdpI family protein n=1 Tax=Nocardiopsis sp. CC223A TaxID=3044051 RepID=UPI00278BB944|nr:SdpI family protein [Nocardiopsis sp. CC223A]
MSADAVLPHIWADQPLSGGTLAWLSIILVVAALVLFAVGAMGHGGRLRPNRVVGIRTAYTESDHEAWYDVHAKAAPWLIASGAVLIIGTATLNLTDTPRLQFLALMVSIVVGTAVLLIGTGSAHSSVRRRNENDQSAGEQERTP